MAKTTDRVQGTLEMIGGALFRRRSSAAGHSGRVGRASRLVDHVFNRPVMIKPERFDAIQAFVAREHMGHSVDPVVAQQLIKQAVEADGRAGATATPDSDDSVRGGDSVVVDGVAVIPVEGVLMKRGYFDFESCEDVAGYEEIGIEIERAMSDDGVKAVLLKVWSPGGGVDGAFELADQVRAAADSGIKPVGAFIDGCGCSAAYAIACGVQAGRLYTTRASDVGHVGVIASYVDITKMLAKEGVTPYVLSAGTGKSSGHPMKEQDKEDVGRLQGEIDSLYEQFITTVSLGREVEPDSVRELGAKVCVGKEAVDEGLVDAVTDLPTAIAEMAKAGRSTATTSASSARRHSRGASQMPLKPLATKTRPGAQDEKKQGENDMPKKTGTTDDDKPELEEEREENADAQGDSDDKKNDADAQGDSDDKKNDADAQGDGDDKKNDADAQGDGDEETKREAVGDDGEEPEAEGDERKDPDAMTTNVKKAERERQAGIRDAAKKLDQTGTDLEAELLDGDFTVAQAQVKLIDASVASRDAEKLEKNRDEALEDLVGSKSEIVASLGGDGTGRVMAAKDLEGAADVLQEYASKQGEKLDRAHAIHRAALVRPELWRDQHRAIAKDMPKKMPASD